MTSQNPWGDDEELFDIPPPPPPPPPQTWLQPSPPIFGVPPLGDPRHPYQYPTQRVEDRGWNSTLFWVLLFVIAPAGVAYGFIAGSRRQRVRLGQWILGGLGVIIFFAGRIDDPDTNRSSPSTTAIGAAMLVGFVVLTLWYAGQRRAGRP